MSSDFDWDFDSDSEDSLSDEPATLNDPKETAVDPKETVPTVLDRNSTSTTASGGGAGADHVLQAEDKAPIGRGADHVLQEDADIIHQLSSEEGVKLKFTVAVTTRYQTVPITANFPIPSGRTVVAEDHTAPIPSGSTVVAEDPSSSSTSAGEDKASVSSLLPNCTAAEDKASFSSLLAAYAESCRSLQCIEVDVTTPRSRGRPKKTPSCGVATRPGAASSASARNSAAGGGAQKEQSTSTSAPQKGGAKAAAAKKKGGAKGAAASTSTKCDNSPFQFAPLLTRMQYEYCLRCAAGGQPLNQRRFEATSMSDILDNEHVQIYQKKTAISSSELRRKLAEGLANFQGQQVASVAFTDLHGCVPWQGDNWACIRTRSIDILSVRAVDNQRQNTISSCVETAAASRAADARSRIEEMEEEKKHLCADADEKKEGPRLGEDGDVMGATMRCEQKNHLEDCDLGAAGRDSDAASLKPVEGVTALGTNDAQQDEVSQLPEPEEKMAISEQTKKEEAAASISSVRSCGQKEESPEETGGKQTPSRPSSNSKMFVATSSDRSRTPRRKMLIAASKKATPKKAATPKKTRTPADQNSASATVHRRKTASLRENGGSSGKKRKTASSQDVEKAVVDGAALDQGAAVDQSACSTSKDCKTPNKSTTSKQPCQTDTPASKKHKSPPHEEHKGSPPIRFSRHPASNAGSSVAPNASSGLGATRGLKNKARTKITSTTRKPASSTTRKATSMSKGKKTKARTVCQTAGFEALRSRIRAKEAAARGA
ncbi:unnamed protein product [Amoebophrya sp. A25]|nr:unnamed protein product [Amoebophrya sp. A25]|eukprot:GSA25T00003618001.1